MKKFFSAILLMTAMVLSVGTFVACNDLTEEMETVQGQATQNAAAISALETQISALQTALATAQSTADAAKKAGDDAAAAAAQAKADAIKEAKAECEVVKAALETKIKEVETALAGKASKEELQKAIDDATAGLKALEAALGAKISGIEEDLNKLATKEQLDADVAKLLAADEDLKLQIAALEAYQAKADTTFATKQEAEAIREELAKLAAENYNELQKLIGGNASAIQATIDTVDIIAAALQGYMDSNDARFNELAKSLAGVIETAASNEELISELTEALKAEMADTDADFVRISEQIAETNAYLDETIVQIAERFKNAELNTKMLTDALAASVEDLGTELRAEIKAVKDGLAALTPRVEDLEAEVADIDADLSTLKTLVKNTLRSITFIPDTYVDGVEAVAFNNSLVYLPIAEDAKDGKVNDKVTLPTDQTAVWKDVLSASAVETINYHFNPSSFKLDNASYKFLVKQATNIETNIETKAEASYPFWATDYEIAPTAKDGVVSVPVRRANVWQTMTSRDAEKFNIIALEATIKADANQVTSPYVMAYDNPFDVTSLAIACNKATHHTADVHFATTYEKAQAEEPHFEVVYNQTFNLKELVETHKLGAKCEDFDLAAYEMTYRFSKPTEPYLIESDKTMTDQQTVIQCTSATEGTYALTEKFGLESVGRTPILRVEILDKNGKIVKRAYVKVKMVVNRNPDFVVSESHKDVVYNCPDDPNTYEYNVEWMRENIYRAISAQDGKTTISHELFWNLYEEDDAYVTTTGTDRVNVPVPVLLSGDSDQDTATKAIKWSFSDGQASAAFKNKLDQKGKKMWGVLVLKNQFDSSEYPAQVTIKFEVNVKLPDVAATYTENEVYWAKDGDECVAFVSNVNTPEYLHSPANECQFHTYLADAFVGAHKFTGKPACGTLTYRISPEWIDEMEEKYPTLTELTEGVRLESDDRGVYITLDKLNEDVKLLLNAPEGLSTIVEYVYTFANGCEDILFSFPVVFVQPVHMNTPAGLQVQDAKTGGDVASYNVFNLLVDWRNEPIIPTDVKTIPVATPFWNKVCTPHFQYVPARQEIVKEGYYKLITEKVTVNETTTGFTATATLELKNAWKGQEANAKVLDTKTIETEEVYASPANAVEALNEILEAMNAEIVKNNGIQVGGTFHILQHTDEYPYEEGKGYNRDGYYLAWEMGAVDTAEETVTVGKEITFVTGLDYVPAEFKTIPEQWIATPCNEKPGIPDYEIDFGYRVGCWEWTEAYNDVDYELTGQYWEFYGPIEFTAETDLTKITTNLADGKLPSTVTLTVEQPEIGTITYKNVGTPVEHPYNIYIPVYVNYGWGSFQDVITVKVLPHTAPQK